MSGDYVTYVVIAMRTLFVSVFATAVGTKVRSRSAFSEFRVSLSQLHVLDSSRIRQAASATVVAEVAVPVLLLLPLAVPNLSSGAPRQACLSAGFLIAAGLLVGFAAVTVVAIRRGVRAPCRCFGPTPTPLGPQHVARNCVLAFLAVAGLLATVYSHAAADHAEAAIAGASGLICGLLVVAFDDLVALFQPIDR